MVTFMFITLPKAFTATTFQSFATKKKPLYDKPSGWAANVAHFCNERKAIIHRTQKHQNPLKRTDDKISTEALVPGFSSCIELNPKDVGRRWVGWGGVRILSAWNSPLPVLTLSAVGGRHTPTRRAKPHIICANWSVERLSSLALQRWPPGWLQPWRSLHKTAADFKFSNYNYLS